MFAVSGRVVAILDRTCLRPAAPTGDILMELGTNRDGFLDRLDAENEPRSTRPNKEELFQPPNAFWLLLGGYPRFARKLIKNGLLVEGPNHFPAWNRHRFHVLAFRKSLQIWFERLFSFFKK